MKKKEEDFINYTIFTKKNEIRELKELTVLYKQEPVLLNSVHIEIEVREIAIKKFEELLNKGSN